MSIRPGRPSQPLREQIWSGVSVFDLGLIHVATVVCLFAASLRRVLIPAWKWSTEEKRNERRNGKDGKGSCPRNKVALKRRSRHVWWRENVFFIIIIIFGLVDY